MSMTVEAATPPRRPMRELLRRAGRFARPHGRKLTAAACMALVIAALGAGEPLTLKWIFDGLAGPSAPRRLAALGGVLLALLACKELIAARLD